MWYNIPKCVKETAEGLYGRLQSVRKPDHYRIRRIYGN